MDFEKAIELLLSNKDFTCVIVRGEDITISEEKGLRPLMRPMLKDELSLKDALIADKIIGKAAAAIVVCGKAKTCYGHIMSKEAIEFFEANNIKYSYGKLVEKIKNKDGSDNCPMEKMVEKFETEIESYVFLRDFLRPKLTNIDIEKL